ncbi:MAG: hypothetical protein QM741_13040 [Rudaea sp.]|uniref:hypothetical protein n=1 Tax=Rudaea sp. TaxID=2136325 RepID=UPI0039E25C4F
MSFDVSQLSAAELDELIARAAVRRAALEPAPPAQPPEKAEAIVNPAWHTSPLPNGVLLMLRHPGLGWVAFALPHEHRVHLASLWLHQSLLFKPTETTAEAATPAAVVPDVGTGGSGTVH